MFWNTARTVEIAAKLINKKNNVPQILPPGIFANTWGRVINNNEGPAPGLIPYVKHAGKIIRPADIATKVSRTAILTLSPSNDLSLLIKLPKIAIEPIPKLKVKKAWLIAFTITVKPALKSLNTLKLGIK